jgi:hypothetical protein
MWSFIKRVLTSRIGQLLAAVHLLLVVYDFAQKDVQRYAPGERCTPVSEWDVTGGLIAGRFFHFSYESTLHKLTVLADLPSLLLCSLLTAPLYRLYPNMCVVTTSWIDAAVLIVVTSGQWLLVGFAIERLARGLTPLK